LQTPRSVAANEAKGLVNAAKFTAAESRTLGGYEISSGTLNNYLIFHPYFTAILVANWQHAPTKFGDNLRLPLTENAVRMC
jgi:hypothetical protein